MQEQVALVYPNPAENTLFVQNGLIRQHADFTLYDMQGRKVFTKQLQALENQMDISGLPSGIYLYRIAGTGKIYQTGKFVKQ